MDRIQLKTFQPLTRVRTLEATGELRGSWAQILSVSYDPAYRDMVSEMARAGIDCAGNPPIWAWYGPLALIDATMLLNEEYDLPKGYATITFTAPRDLVLLSEYGPWCEALFPYRPWRAPTPPLIPDPAVQLQATLPVIRASWVSDITELPTSGFDELDMEQPV
ncbi:hypothetical protein CKALI_12110 [Corynebacterium kalinowskii]|uniref:Uncharacterized protein n=1 Tax=Corynebacterium kalinowskii TaxID=2675216 RepID=A0A6B8W0W1_9CORY|nr:hypothetical protein [Corynebacterium kalinowskii]QGU03260.1 hypothetical protein CKALI_12110 [Corynebacterium kalinowskii]